MNFDLEEKLTGLVQENKIEEAIGVAEGALLDFPHTAFHKVLGRNLLHHTQALANHIDDFYKSAPKGSKVKAMYAEMNGFTVNYDLWFVNLFAFKNCGDLDDLDWLAVFDFYSDEILVLTGMEDLQSVYKDYMENEKWNDKTLEDTSALSELIIILRLQELFSEVRKVATVQNLSWKNIPLFSTAHDSEMIYKTKG
jgi:hypothetical protein